MTSVFILVFARTVSAHVSVQPKEAIVGYSVSSVRVPNEKETATTKVRVVVPEGVDVHGVMPIAGWQYILTREESGNSTETIEGEDHHGDEGRITEIAWSGGRIGVGEFMEFPLSVQYAADIDEAIWKAYQTYADGEVVPWDGSDEKHPAPQVTVLKEAKADSRVSKTTSAQTPWMNVAALLLSIAALAVSLKKK